MTHFSSNRLKLLAIARKAGDRWFDPKTNTCIISRDTLWYAISLLFDPSPSRQELGQRLIVGIRSEDGTHTPATMLAILLGLSSRLSPAARAHLNSEIERELVHAAETQWRDGNVNHPLGAYCTLILGGELTGATWAVELGHRRLSEFQRLIGDRRFRHHRQAEMSEYLSPTYTALDILFLALIAEYAVATETQTLASFLERRLWLDIALHFHPPSEQFAGPYSRAYQDDSTGGFSALHTVLLAATDRDLFMNPDLCIRFNHPSTLLQCSLTAIVPMHMTDESVRLCWEKPFPVLMQKTTYCEQYHENSRRVVVDSKPGSTAFAFDDEVYAGGLRDLTTFLTGEYALGTASLPYVNAGHADSFTLRIRRAEKIRGMGDFRSAYTRGVFNDAVVGSRNDCHVTRGSIDESYLYEEGRCAVFQHRNHAIVLYTPKRSGHLEVKSFQMELIFSFYAPFTALLLGEEPVGQLPVTAPSGTRLYFQDYHTYGVVIPLGPEPACDDAPVRLRVHNDHFLYSLFNYDGSERDFAREEIMRWRTGFAVELATADEFTSFDSFVNHARSLEVSETVTADGIRTVIFRSAEGTMKAMYDPRTECFLSRTWDGAEDSVEHLRIEGGPSLLQLISPLTLFGSEAMQEIRRR